MSTPFHRITPDEYLQFERPADTKNEYYDGEILARPGGSPDHSFIAIRASSILDRQAPAGCRVFNSDMRIQIPGRRNFVYADAGLVCGEPEVGDDASRDNLLNPSLIVEVLSPATERHDRGLKFQLYQKTGSFCEYLIVHQDHRMVEHYSKQTDGSWVYRPVSGRPVSGIDAKVRIERWGIEVPLRDLYANAVGLAD